jgi:hypothetical protein
VEQPQEMLEDLVADLPNIQHHNHLDLEIVQHHILLHKEIQVVLQVEMVEETVVRENGLLVVVVPVLLVVHLLVH